MFLGFSMLPAALNLFFPGDPGFLTLVSTPYLAAASLAAAMNGVAAGFLCLAAASVFAFSFTLYFGVALKPVHFAPWAAAVLIVYSFGRISESFSLKNKKLLERYRELVKWERRLRRLTDGLYAVNRNFEERVARQRDSFTLLYRQVLAMNALSIQENAQGAARDDDAFLLGNPGFGLELQLERPGPEVRGRGRLGNRGPNPPSPFPRRVRSKAGSSATARSFPSGCCFSTRTSASLIPEETSSPFRSTRARKNGES